MPPIGAVGVTVTIMVAWFLATGTGWAVPIIAASTGKVDLNFKRFVNLPANASFSGGVYAEANEERGVKTDITLSDPAFSTKPIFIFKATQPLKGDYPGFGLNPVPKFPGGNPTCGFMSMEKTAGSTTDHTTSSAISRFCSSIEDTGGGPQRRAQIEALGEITTTGPINRLFGKGIAVANANDPWSFVLDSPTQFDLTVTLNDLFLHAESESGSAAIGAFETFGSLSFNDNTGTHALLSWSYSDFVDGTASKAVSSLVLLDASILLLPDIRYTFDATALSLAAVSVPEPASMLLLCTGLLVLSICRLEHHQHRRSVRARG